MSSSTAPTILIFRENRAYRRIQRTLDLLISIPIVILVLPVMAACALAIWLDDRGPVFFKQRRTGRFERLFTIYKLRTMSVNRCVDALSPSTSNDSRITRVGRFLRRTSLDEIPQLINVIRGEMSLVGPRPEMPFVVRKYEHWQHLRHITVPGITCIWQTRYRSVVPLHEPAATICDLEYIERASPFADGQLLAATIGAVLSPKGAY